MISKRGFRFLVFQGTLTTLWTSTPSFALEMRPSLVTAKSMDMKTRGVRVFHKQTKCVRTVAGISHQWHGPIPVRRFY